MDEQLAILLEDLAYALKQHGGYITADGPITVGYTTALECDEIESAA